MRAANFCRELGHQRVGLEGDTLQVVHALWKEDRNLSKYGYLIEETRRVLSCLQQ
jgi:hypothetical protein